MEFRQREILNCERVKRKKLRDEFLRVFSPKMRGKKWYEWIVKRMNLMLMKMNQFFSQIMKGLKEKMVGFKN